MNPKPPTIIRPDSIPLTQLEALPLTEGEWARVRTLNTKKDRFLDAGELGKALIGAGSPRRSADRVVGRLFSEGLQRPSLRPNLAATFNAISNPAIQFRLLMSLDSASQARLIQIVAQMTSRADLAYIWYQFVFAESGILGGILLNHLRAMDPELAKELIEGALNRCGDGTEFRRQFQDHLKTAQDVQKLSPSALSYFPTADEARQFLQLRGVPIPSDKEFPSALVSIAPHIRGPRPWGVVVIVHRGHGYIRTPRTQFFPREYVTQLARGTLAEGLHWRYEKGRQLREDDHGDEAIHLFEKILAEHPQEVQAYLEIGIVYNGRYNKTNDQATLRKVIEHYEKAVNGWQTLLARNPAYFDNRLAEEIRYEYAKESLHVLQDELQ